MACTLLAATSLRLLAGPQADLVSACPHEETFPWPDSGDSSIPTTTPAPQQAAKPQRALRLSIKRIHTSPTPR